MAVVVLFRIQFRGASVTLQSNVSQLWAAHAGGEWTTDIQGTGGHSVIYLASPYSHAEAAVREQRFQLTCQMVAELLREGHVVFSPIVHGHPLVAFGLPTDWGFWETFARELIRLCEVLAVFMLDGWRESVGVQAEIQIANELGRPVRYLPLVGTPTFVTTARGLAT